MARSSADGSARPARLATGLGRVLVVVYAILALAATGRSVTQIATRFSEAPGAYALSGLAAVVYIVATVALVGPGGERRRAGWTRVAWITIGFELIGVLVVGTISFVAPGALGIHDPDPFGRQSTVWSVYGAGYLFVPLALPILGLLWLRSRTRAGARAADPGAAADAGGPARPDGDAGADA